MNRGLRRIVIEGREAHAKGAERDQNPYMAFRAAASPTLRNLGSRYRDAWWQGWDEAAWNATHVGAPHA